MYLPNVNGEFRAAADPELRFTPSGKAVATLRAVASSRRKNPETEEWEDDKTFWTKVTIWGQTAENVVESIGKGDLFLIANGRGETEEWEDKEGQKRVGINVTANEIGPSLNWQTAKVVRAQRSQGQGQQQAPPQQQQGGQWGQQQSDPWQTGGGGAPSDEPPF
jgi:single-strand DNA-binding protein